MYRHIKIYQKREINNFVCRLAWVGPLCCRSVYRTGYGNIKIKGKKCYAAVI